MATSDHRATRTGPLTVLVDGNCPFCRLERRWLQRLDARRASDGFGLCFDDIADPTFDASLYGLELAALHGSIHAVEPDGTVLRGMDVFRAAYGAIGLGWLLAPTGWPLLKPVCDLGYRLFARYRVRLGRLFGRGCDDGSCGI